MTEIEAAKLDAKAAIRKIAPHVPNSEACEALEEIHEFLGMVAPHLENEPHPKLISEELVK